MKHSIVVRGVLAWALTAVGLRAVVLQPEQCGDPAAADTRAAASAAVGWFSENQDSSGRWLYRYDRSTDTDLGGYHVVRHVGAVEALEKAASAGIDGAAEAADRGTAWALRRTVDVANGRALPDRPGVASSGGAALWVAGLLERRDRTGDTVHDDLLADLGLFLASMVTPEGAVIARYDLDADEPEFDSRSKFYTGETLWALARLHEVFPGQGWDEPALRIARYLPDRDDVEAVWPPLPDHWAAYGFATMARWPEPPSLTAAQIEWIERQFAIQSVQIRYESQRTESTWTHLTRGRPTLGAGLGTLGEALNQWWLVARTDSRLADAAPTLAERGSCVAGVLVNRQADDGAWYQFDVTQIDDQQHTLSALIFVEPLLADDSTEDSAR